MKILEFANAVLDVIERNILPFVFGFACGGFIVIMRIIDEI
jgi:hypothetical protein